MKQQYLCPVDNEIVDRASMVKGYEFSRDQFVQFTEDELKKLESPKTDELSLIEFVPADTVDLIYVEKSYYLGPDKGGERAYRLLSEAMDQTGRIAVGRFNTRGKDQLVLVRPYRKGLILHQVYYADEVRSFDEVETGGDFEYKDVERELAERLIEELGEDEFDPTKFKDTYADRVRDAVEQKVAGKEITAPAAEPKAQIIDLLEALKRSVGGKKSEGGDDDSTVAKPPKKAGSRKEGDKKKRSTA